MQRFSRTAAVLLSAGFLLGSYKGYVALWDEDRPEPIRIYPCPVSALPETDQEALRQGIPARSPLELEQLLEDYLS